ncbi:MAG: acyl carrier protein [Ruminococcus flavefaciens]|nr:acyl carrier protein [Ruminococcus flavefaciens]
MLKLQYVGEDITHIVEFHRINKHVVQIRGDLPIKTSGFICSKLAADNGWDYTDFTTIYRLIDGGAQFSNNGSTYTAPPVPEPLPEPEPYVPTLEEVKETKRQEIRMAYQSVKAAGVDVELSVGREHFPLSDEEVSFLYGKQIELSTGNNEPVAYQDSSNRCKFYSKDDMQIIINEAFKFVSYQTTYRNSLWEWIDECQTKEEVEAIFYGCDIPEQYQNDVFKSYLKQMKEAADESI